MTNGQAVTQRAVQRVPSRSVSLRSRRLRTPERKAAMTELLKCAYMFRQHAAMQHGLPNPEGLTMIEEDDETVESYELDEQVVVDKQYEPGVKQEIDPEPTGDLTADAIREVAQVFINQPKPEPPPADTSTADAIREVAQIFVDAPKSESPPVDTSTADAIREVGEILASRPTPEPADTATADAIREIGVAIVQQPAAEPDTSTADAVRDVGKLIASNMGLSSTAEGQSPMSKWKRAALIAGLLGAAGVVGAGSNWWLKGKASSGIAVDADILKARATLIELQQAGYGLAPTQLGGDIREAFEKDPEFRRRFMEEVRKTLGKDAAGK